MSFFADDCVLDMPRGPAPGGQRLVGKPQVRAGIQARFDGIPDIHYATGRAVSAPFRVDDSRSGDSIEVRACDLFEFTDGKISRKDSFRKIVD